MIASLIARALPGDLFEWATVDQDGASVPPARGSVESLIGACAERDLTLLLDGRSVGTLPVTIPAKSQRQARIAAPYAIEDDVTEELDALYVTCGPAEEDGQRTVGYTRKAELDSLLAPLAEARIALRGVRPDYLALPWSPGQWSVLLDEDRLLVRTAARQGFVVESELAAEVISRKLAERAPEHIVLFGEGALPPALLALPSTRQPLVAGPWSALVKGATESAGIDWLPDTFPRPRNAQRAAWLWAMGLLALSLVTHVGFLVAGNARLQAQIADLREAQAEVMRGTFPEITRIVNAEIQASQAVAALRAAGTVEVSVLELLHGLGLASDAQAGRFRLLNVNYANGMMSVQALAQDIASLEGLGADATLPVLIEILSVENRESGVVGNLRVSRKELGP
jgi:general secretion pathway protein L